MSDSLSHDATKSISETPAELLERVYSNLVLLQEVTDTEVGDRAVEKMYGFSKRAIVAMMDYKKALRASEPCPLCKCVPCLATCVRSASANNPANPERRSSLEHSEVKPDGNKERSGEVDREVSRSADITRGDAMGAGRAECGSRASGGESDEVTGEGTSVPSATASIRVPRDQLIEWALWLKGRREVAGQVSMDSIETAILDLLNAPNDIGQSRG